MAKNDLIGGSLWEQYSNKVNSRMANPTHFGELTEEDAQAAGGRLIVADYGAEACGDAIRLTLIIDEDDDRIIDARFKTFGCGTAIASSDVMTEMCIGETVDEALKITNIDVERALRDEEDKAAIPPQKMHCSVMAYDVIKKAVSQYKGVDMEDIENEEIVCQCARVSLGTLKEVIRLNNLKTVEEITNYTKAGAFCKSCVRPGGHEERKYYLTDILRDVRAEMEREKMSDNAKQEETKTFSELNLIKKHKAVEDALDQYVRPFLAADGGGVEVEDLQEQDGNIIVSVNYSGACRGCMAALSGTLGFMQKTLQEKLDPNIQVTV